MSDSIETSEDMAMPFDGALPGTDGQIDPLTRAVQLLREVAVEYARSVSIGDVPDWENEPEAKAAHDEALLIARHLEAMATAATAPSKPLPQIDYEALIAACYQKTKYAQGTGGCVAFAKGAEWYREQCAAARTRGEALTSKPQDAQVPHA